MRHEARYHEAAGDVADPNLAAFVRDIDAWVEALRDRFGAPLAYREPWVWDFFGKQGVFHLTCKR